MAKGHNDQYSNTLVHTRVYIHGFVLTVSIVVSGVQWFEKSVGLIPAEYGELEELSLMGKRFIGPCFQDYLK
jgi:hypothetical protein